MIELTRRYGRYGYRRIAVLLRDAGCPLSADCFAIACRQRVNDKRVEGLWRREGFRVPQKQPKKGRLWLTDGSCVRLRPEYRDHVPLSHMHACAAGQRDRMTSCIIGAITGKAFRTLNMLDEHSRGCLLIRVKRKLNSTESFMH